LLQFIIERLTDEEQEQQRKVQKPKEENRSHSFEKVFHFCRDFETVSYSPRIYVDADDVVVVVVIRNVMTISKNQQLHQNFLGTFKILLRRVNFQIFFPKSFQRLQPLRAHSLSHHSRNLVNLGTIEVSFLSLFFLFLSLFLPLS
jgi:hypothetical protein